MPAIIRKHSKKYLSMSKITVKHYLNTQIQPLIIDGKAKYHIYFRLTFNRRTTQFKSKEFEKEPFTLEEFNHLVNLKDYTQRTELETNVIENVVKAQLNLVKTDLV